MMRHADIDMAESADTLSPFAGRRRNDQAGAEGMRGGRRREDVIDTQQRGALGRHLLSLLIVERVVLALTGLGVLLALWDVRKVDFPWQLTGLVLLSVIALSAALRVRIRAGKEPTESVFVVHLLADIALLTFAFHHAGGAENPFLVFYMLPLTLAAYALSWPRLLGVVVATCLMVALLGQRENQALHFDYAVHETSELIAVAVITYFAYVVSRLSRDHDRRVSRAREEALNAMGSQALGSVAARAADTMSSPLSTMSVLVNELRQERLTELEREAALQTLTLQIAQCKTRLSELLDSVGHARAGNGEARDIRALVQTAVHECELIDPDLQIDIDQPTQSAPRVVEERSLLDALVMLIRLCGRSEPHQVHIEIRWSRHWVQLELLGRAGAPDAACAGAGGDGSIALAATMIERFKGSLSCRVDERQWLLRIHLPALAAPRHERPIPALNTK